MAALTCSPSAGADSHDVAMKMWQENVEPEVKGVARFTSGSGLPLPAGLACFEEEKAPKMEGENDCIAKGLMIKRPINLPIEAVRGGFHAAGQREFGTPVAASQNSPTGVNELNVHRSAPGRLVGQRLATAAANGQFLASPLGGGVGCGTGFAAVSIPQLPFGGYCAAKRSKRPPDTVIYVDHEFRNEPNLPPKRPSAPAEFAPMPSGTKGQPTAPSSRSGSRTGRNAVPRAPRSSPPGSRTGSHSAPLAPVYCAEVPSVGLASFSSASLQSPTRSRSPQLIEGASATHSCREQLPPLPPTLSPATSETEDDDVDMDKENMCVDQATTPSSSGRSRPLAEESHARALQELELEEYEEKENLPMQPVRADTEEASSSSQAVQVHTASRSGARSSSQVTDGRALQEMPANWTEGLQPPEVQDCSSSETESDASSEFVSENLADHLADRIERNENLQKEKGWYDFEIYTDPIDSE
eukprot:gnl/TRDRNA2_/TRDRNA2_42932_c0_seq1.p1 gnl/TRDRNA2_/TRDRNA2_42932_c0~~gnl/TRDRNA2_/TRDRNA2_42932_c0_seq1.p1  ORF type:complete len:472 (-),score=93.65 gnl/TRDRNA2_/TRDRNA2_42932_c0_seq1:123-1538(-)